LLAGAESCSTSGREATLELDVAKLVDRAHLPQHLPLMGVGEKGRLRAAA
jgi:hypothetical protein